MSMLELSEVIFPSSPSIDKLFITTFPVPCGVMFISAFEPLLAISFVVKAPVVTPPDNVTAPVNVPVVAVNAATSNAPAVTVMPPDLSAPVAVVVPNLNVSADSSHIIQALFPVDPRSIIIPESFVLAEIPVCNSKGKFMGKAINQLNKKKIKLNITAVYSANQTKKY